MSSELITSHSASQPVKPVNQLTRQPARQVSLSPPLSWSSSLELKYFRNSRSTKQLLAVSKKNPSVPFFTTHSSTYLYIYMHSILFGTEGGQRLSEAFSTHHKSVQRSKGVSSVCPNASRCPGNFLTQMEMDLSKLTHNVPLSVFQNDTQAGNLFTKVRK